MTTLQAHQFTCPLCSSAFETNLVTSTNSLGQMHSDLYREAAGAQPVCFFVHSCPDCGYSGFDGDFQPQAFSQEFRQQVAEVITPEVRERKIETNGHYYLAALCAEWRGASPLTLGRIYQMGAWCHRLKKETEKEHFFLSKAVEYFEKGIAEGEPSQENAALYAYLVGDLYRRLGDERATAWYERAIAAAKDGGEGIGSFARRQLTSPADIF